MERQHKIFNMKILILFALLFITVNTYAQQKIYSLWSPKVGLVKDLTAIKSGGSGFIIMPYTPVQYDYDEDSLRMYYYDYANAQTKLAKSLDGIEWQDFANIPNGTMESAVRENGSATDWYMLFHHISNRQYRLSIGGSTNDGLTWYQTSDTLNDGSKHVGEDHTSFYNPDSNKYYIFIRTNTSLDGGMQRKISLTKTADYSTFTPRTKVVPQDTNNFYRPKSKDYHKAFYNGSMFTTGPGEYWLYVNVLKIDDALRDTEQPMYDTSGTDNCVWGELMFSTDGDNWKRCNDSLAFLPLNNSKRQIFGLPSVIGDSLIVYTFESNQRHISGAINNWEIWRYKISIADLRKYKY